MKASSATAGVFAALVLAATPVLSTALADEVYEEEYAVEYEGEEAYVDDGEDYGSEPPPRHTSYKDDPVPTKGSVKDGYPVPMPPPDDDYADAPPPAKYAAPPPRPLPPKRFACLESWEIERTLADHGWTRIHALSTRRGVTRIRARRYDSGRPFILRVDRCSGELISARPRLRVFGARHDGPWHPHRWAGR